VRVAARLKTERERLAYLERVMWNRGPECPVCRAGGVRKIRKRFRRVVPAQLFNCPYCQYQFTVLTRSIFEWSHLPLRKWFSAISLVLSNPDITIRRLQKEISTTYKTAWILKWIITNIETYELDEDRDLILRKRDPQSKEQNRWIHPEAFRKTLLPVPKRFAKAEQEHQRFLAKIYAAKSKEERDQIWRERMGLRPSSSLLD
jgi:transposase-like protein